MPSSPSESIPYIIEFIRKNNPNLHSALDIGIGFGKIGYLLREYFDVKKDLVYQPKDWKLKLTGVEIYEPYVSDIQRKIYNDVIIGDIFDVLNHLKKFDIAILSEVLEHMPKQKGKELLKKLFEHVEGIIVSTPNGFLEHPSRNENIYEEHLSGWTIDDFSDYTILDEATYKGIRSDNETLTVYIRK